jgi:hypothetical protein
MHACMNGPSAQALSKELLYYYFVNMDDFKVIQ